MSPNTCPPCLRSLQAVFALARKLAVLIYRMLRYGQDYVDEGAERYEDRFCQRRLCSLKMSARSLGFTLVPEAEANAA